MIEASRRDFMVGVAATAVLASAATVMAAPQTINERWLYWYDVSRDLAMVRGDFANWEMAIPDGAIVASPQDIEWAKNENPELVRKAVSMVRPGIQVGIDFVRNPA